MTESATLEVEEDVQTVMTFDDGEVMMVFTVEQAEALVDEHSDYEFNVDSGNDQVKTLRHAELTKVDEDTVEVTASEEQFDEFFAKLSGNGPSMAELLEGDA